MSSRRKFKITAARCSISHSLLYYPYDNRLLRCIIFIKKKKKKKVKNYLICLYYNLAFAEFVICVHYFIQILFPHCTFTQGGDCRYIIRGKVKISNNNTEMLFITCMMGYISYRRLLKSLLKQSHDFHFNSA